MNMIVKTFKKIFRFVFSKLFLVLLAVLLQFSLAYLAVTAFSEVGYLFSVFLVIVKLVFMFRIINSEIAPEYKSVWLITVLISTFVGVILYFYFGRVKLGGKTKMKMQYIDMTLKERQEKYPAALPDDKTARNICKYLSSSCATAPFAGNHTEYFSVGESFFEKLFSELEKAEKYIYLDYFIICDGAIWDRLFEILGRKIAEGVDVRLIYDDVGSILKIDKRFAKKLEESGIKTLVFNKVSSTMSSRQNNRDHRKVCIIDGVTCFVGGINLSDEYANITKPFGYWKDTAVMISGSAVLAFTDEFLACFDGFFSDRFTFEEACAVREVSFDEKGIVAPYFDSPFENIQICRDIYEDLISSAEKSVYITTPYFVPDYSIENALKNALERGVDVKIIIPGIYDKWYVRELSRMYASRLEKYGAEVFEYTPGFLHQKMLVVDGEYAVCGSSNVDFRSFYLSFESGVFMYNTAIIKDMSADFESMVEKSEFFFENSGSIGVFRWLFRHTFAVFSPLM